MKSVCTNLEDCGTVEYFTPNKTQTQYATTCTNCGSVSLIYYEDQTPIFKEQYTNYEINEILINGLIGIKLGEKNDNNQFEENSTIRKQENKKPKS